MNWRYGIHPKDYAIGETEQYYADMAAKGWKLVKRGITFSRFQRTEPAQVRYRVEVVSPQSLSDGFLPEEQVAIYAECGWEYVMSRGFLHVFCAPEGSDAPEFYLEPKQQAATLKGLRLKYINAIISPLLLIVFSTFMAALVEGLFNGRWAAQLYRLWMEETALAIGLGVFLLWVVASDLWGFLHLNRLYQRMKKGIPLNHSPGSRQRILIPRFISITLFLCAILCTAYNFWYDDFYEMDNIAHGPYLLLSDLGIEGERSLNPVNDTESSVKFSRSLLVDCWHTQEFITGDSLGKKFEKWMYQDIYVLKESSDMGRFVNALMVSSVFSQSTSDYTPVQIPGLDQAWITDRLECIAVKGSTIHTLSYPFATQDEMKMILSIIAER